MRLKSLAVGAGLAVMARALTMRILLTRTASDVRKLNAGDYSSLLQLYGNDFVLHFNDGEHRWAGDWAGRVNMDRFLQNFVAARIQGEVRELAMSGPPWAMTMWVRFDDRAHGPDGARIYQNRTVLVLRTRWGRVVEQDDFYVDTGAIVDLERKLTEMGVEPITKIDPSKSDPVPH